MKIYHVADLHLGYKQYNLDSRLHDFARAWFWVAMTAAQDHADMVLIAGDIFDRPDVSADTLADFKSGLYSLQVQNIPVVTIAGNHDAGNYNFLDYLNYSGDIINLHKEKFIIKNGDICIVGLEYNGVYNQTILQATEYKSTPEYQKSKYHILMLHGGVRGMNDAVEPSAFDSEYLLSLGFDYVAMGHIHFKNELGTIHFPGSLESCKYDEYNNGGGYYVIDNGLVEHHEYKLKRTFVTISVERRNIIADTVPPNSIVICKTDDSLPVHVIKNQFKNNPIRLVRAAQQKMQNRFNYAGLEEILGSDHDLFLQLLDVDKGTVREMLC